MMGGGGMAGMGGMGGMGSGTAGMGGMGGGMGAIGGMGGVRGAMGGMGGGLGAMPGPRAGLGGFGSGDIGPTPRPGRAHESNREQQTPGPHDPAAAADGSTSIAAIPSSGKEAVDLAERVAELKAGARPDSAATERTLAGRRFKKVGEAWIDQTFKSPMLTVRIRVLGIAYFQLLAKHPELTAIFALGSRITWVSPSGTALIIDKQGQESLTELVCKQLFERRDTRGAREAK
jgi:hypothetical protein